MAFKILFSGQLPFDIIELVFKFLPIEDHVECLMVSKQWFHFIMELPKSSNLVLAGFPSLVNNDATMDLIQRIMALKTSNSSFVIHGSPSIATADEQEYKIKNDIAPIDAAKLLGIILNKNRIQIDTLCLKDWIVTECDFPKSYAEIESLVDHPCISNYAVESTTVESGIGWDKWLYQINSRCVGVAIAKKLASVVIDNNEAMRQRYKENGGWYPINDSFPRRQPEVYERTAFASSPEVMFIKHFKLSASTLLEPPNSKMYPDHGLFGTLPTLVHIYLDALNHKNPLISARTASDHLPKLRTLIVSPLAEMPTGVRYQVTDPADDVEDRETGNLRCFVWTMGNSRPMNRNTFQWHCRVNRCGCFTKNVSRIVNKHYQHLELLYLQFDGAHGIAFRSIRFLSLPTTLEATHLRELHLHATGSTLFGQFQSTSIKDKKIYGTVDDFNQYLVQAISHLPGLEIIVLKNDDVDYTALLLQDDSALASDVVYMTIGDDILFSLASHCPRLKEVIIWGPHMAITGSGVVEFALTTVSNQGLLTRLALDCLLSDEQIVALINCASLKNLKTLRSKDRSTLCL